MEWSRDGYVISDDPARVDRALVHRFLSEESYWSPGIEPERVERAIANSRVFGVYRDTEQVGFARVVTDCARFAYVADVFVVGTERGRGLGTWLVRVIREHPDLQDVSVWSLATRDAHELYRKFGFETISAERATQLMEHRPAAPR